MRLNVAFNGLGIASVTMVMAGMVTLTTGCSRSQAGGAIIVTESGVRLASIFAGVAANPKLYQIVSGALGSPGACVPKKSGLWDRVSRLVSLRAVKAQTSCSSSDCSGSYFASQVVPCIGGSGCTGSYEVDAAGGTDACSGYQYLGGQACPGCTSGGCATTTCASCSNGGGGGGDGGCDSDPCALDCGIDKDGGCED